MKRLITALALLLVTGILFAQTIPAGRKLFPLAWDYATDTTEAWKAVEGYKFDVMNDQYTIKGYTVTKGLLGYMKQTSTVVLTGKDNTFTTEVVDMESVACNKDGEALKTSKPMKNPKSSWAKLADLISANLTKRITSWTDEEYEAKVNATINPDFLFDAKTNSSDLYMKNFFDTNKVVGRTLNASYKVMSADQSKTAGYKYQINCYYVNFGSITQDTILINILTNNDKALSVKKDSMYAVNGKITDIKYGMGSAFSPLTIIIEEQ